MNRIYIFLLLILFASCELVVDVDIPIEKRSLVLNSFFNPDSVWKARLTLNRHVLDQSSFPYVEDAEVIVFENGLPLDTLTHDSIGYYISDSKTIEQGKQYTIRASSQTLGSVESTSVCPLQIESAFSPIKQTVGEFGEPLYTFSIDFTDPTGENFYQIMAVVETRYTNPYTGQGFINRSNAYVYSDDEGIDDEAISNAEGFLFPDALFENQRFTVNVKMNATRWNAGEAKYFIYFRTVSKDYYKYKVTSLLQDYTSGDPFAQPVKVYNNIGDGFGIFAGYTQNTTVFEE